MKIYLGIIVLLLAFSVSAQSKLLEASSSTCTIVYPDSWIVRPSETDKEITLSGKTPFGESSKYVGTTVYTISENSRFSSVDEAKTAYTEKIKHTEFLKKLSITKEQKISFKGVDAYEIHFKCKVAGISTKCKMILFIHEGDYHELSVTYDTKLPENLVEEAFGVMETFEFK